MLQVAEVYLQRYLFMKDCMFKKQWDNKMQIGFNKERG